MTLKRRGGVGQRGNARGREAPRATVALTTWTSVFPLSRSPAERVERDIGVSLPTQRLQSVVDGYVRTINSQLRQGWTMDIDGNVHGPAGFDGDPALELLTAVLGTDVRAILEAVS